MMNKIPLALTSISLKKLLELGFVRVADLWNKHTMAWKEPSSFFHYPSLRLRSSFNQLTTKLKMLLDLPQGESCFFRILSVATDVVFDSEAKAPNAFFSINANPQTGRLLYHQHSYLQASRQATWPLFPTLLQRCSARIAKMR